MARFITTKQTISELEELIKKADRVLYILSPYLKLSNDFQELINSRNKNEKKTVIIYGKAELKPEQLKFLTGLRHVYLKFHENLHAKCYLNDTRIIITSMNFYEFSMLNNKEMGILYDTSNEQDVEIYNAVLDHIRFIEDNSNDKPFELGNINSDVQIKPSIEKETTVKNINIKHGSEVPNGKTLSTSALSKEVGVSSKELFARFEKLNLIKRVDDDWELTNLGKARGAQIKKGQYGEYIAWPSNIMDVI